MPRTRKRLRVLRAELELTQHELSKRCGLHRTRVAQIETAQGARPRDEEKLAIAIALRVHVNAIAWPDYDAEMSA